MNNKTNQLPGEESWSSPEVLFYKKTGDGPYGHLGTGLMALKCGGQLFVTSFERRLDGQLEAHSLNRIYHFLRKNGRYRSRFDLDDDFEVIQRDMYTAVISYFSLKLGSL